MTSHEIGTTISQTPHGHSATSSSSCSDNSKRRARFRSTRSNSATRSRIRKRQGRDRRRDVTAGRTSAPPPFAARLADPVTLLAVELRPDLDQPPATDRAARPRFTLARRFVGNLWGFAIAHTTPSGRPNLMARARSPPASSRRRSRSRGSSTRPSCPP